MIPKSGMTTADNTDATDIDPVEECRTLACRVTVVFPKTCATSEVSAKSAVSTLEFGMIHPDVNVLPLP